MSKVCNENKSAIKIYAFFLFFFSIFYTNSTNSIARNNKESRLVTAFKTPLSSSVPSRKATAGPALQGLPSLVAGQNTSVI